MTKVVTYQTPGGQQTIDICEKCEAERAFANDWPKNKKGEEYCTVHKGLHEGRCDLCEPATAGKEAE